MPSTSHDYQINESTKEKLKQVATSNIANCLLRRGFKNVLMLGISPLDASLPNMVGFAFTLRFMPAREDIDTMANYGLSSNLHRRAIEECPSGAVLVIDSHGCLEASSAGDLMAARLKSLGAAGLVTDGGFRDTPAMKRVGLAAYQRAAAPPATPIALHPVELNVPVGCAGVAIYPGDVIVGDGETVAVIPKHLADEIAEEAYEIEQYEKFAEIEIARGRSLFGLFPATEESKEEFKKWRAIGKPISA
jgi:regulator of RNase E activity RraA